MIKNIPVLELVNGETITSLFEDAETSTVLVGTSRGRILQLRQIINNIYGTGNRQLAIAAKDGYGNASAVFYEKILFAFYDQILKTNETGQTTHLAKDIAAYSALEQGEINGVFISPVLWAGYDIGYWESIRLHQSCPSDCQAQYFLRTGATTEELYSSSWISFYNGKDALQEIAINLTGSYIQLKIEMTTRVEDQTPHVYDVNIGYRTKHAVYFFTNKFTLEKESNAQHGFFTARYTQMPATEIIFGLSEKNTADWNEYHVFEENKIFDIPEQLANRFKIGIKFISHSLTSASIMDEFAFFFDADKDNLLNE